MYVFSRLPEIFRKPRWPSRDEMAGCLRGELYALSSWARHVNTCTHMCMNRVELSPG